MVEIFPFCGITYNQEKINDLSLVVTQPYDKIDKSMQLTYYQRSDHNIVRIILGQEEAGRLQECGIRPNVEGIRCKRCL